MIVLDTSVIIEILKETGKGSAIVDAVFEEEVSTTSLSFYEVMLGAKQDELADIQKFFNELPMLYFDKTSAAECAFLEKVLTRQGKTVSKIDLLISAVCRANNSDLITLDKDFLKIPGLKLRLF